MIAMYAYSTDGDLDDGRGLMYMVVILGSFLVSNVLIAIISGIMDSLIMQINIIQKHLNDPHLTPIQSSEDFEPAVFGFMSGRWILVLRKVIEETWNSFFTEIEWAYKPANARSTRVIKKPTNEFDPLYLDELEGERLYNEWLEAHARNDRFKEMLKMRYINGTVFIIVGIVFSTLFSAITITIGTFSLVYIVVFSIAWFVDQIYLLIKRVQQPCGNCHHKNFNLYYECSNPDCEHIHKKLSPGPYGVFYHRCLCGEKLPSTFFNGRNSLIGLCKNCENVVTGVGTRPIIIQLIG